MPEQSALEYLEESIAIELEHINGGRWPTKEEIDREITKRVYLLRKEHENDRQDD